MDEEAKNSMEKESRNITDVLRERGRLDQILKEKFTKKMAVLFSDVCGYTQYMDTRGDVAGRAWIQKHNDIVFPIIETHGGEILSVMGDGIMAAFPETLQAVKAAVDIQKNLAGYNQKADKADEIHVTIGINTGEILVDQEHIAGDVVNVAARIESQADPDQILISKEAYEDVCGSEDVLCRAHGTVSVKGKAEPLDLYRVVWQDTDIVIDEYPTVRAVAAGNIPAVKRGKAPSKILQLEMAREDNRLKISAFEQKPGEVSTIRHYEEMPVKIESIGKRCREIVETLNNVNRMGRLSREVLVKLREIGQVFSDELFTLNVKEKLKKTDADHLILNLDDQLVHVPWELLHDGKHFLCQRFSMGRLVKTRQNITEIKSRLLGRPLKMLVLSDPRGDLKGAYREGTQIRDFMDQSRDLVSATLRSDNITPDFIKEKIRNFDLVHFAGHSDYNADDQGASGWRLTDGTLMAKDIFKMAGTSTMPALIFSNACQSARTEEWIIQKDFQDHIFGLANAFVLSGVKHYIGTFWEILDDPSRHFSMEFYKNLLSGMTAGEAVKEARLALINEYGEETIVWASYLLYGDPTSNYLEQVQRANGEQETEGAGVATLATGVRTSEEVIDFAESDAVKKKRRWVGICAAAAAVFVMLLWGYPGFLKFDPGKYESAIMADYHRGDYDAALQGCEALEQKYPKGCLANLIQGHIHLRNGRMDTAVRAYEIVIAAQTATDDQKSEALSGLGRIASIQNRPDKALDYYRRASETSPESPAGYLSQAILLRNQGNYDAALPILEKTRSLAPDDPTVSAITEKTRQQVLFNKDQKQQARIDQLVEELLASAKSPDRAMPSDGWTSTPLSLWIMEFHNKGYALQEGRDQLISAGISKQVLAESRAQLVERAVLDKLLEELKLGSSELADRNTALSLGKIMAAKLILSGKLIHAGPQMQVALRLVETETGRITAAISESMDSRTPDAEMAKGLGDQLVEKLKTLYPLRGKITGVLDDHIQLNIGSRVGLTAGRTVKVIETDAQMEIVSVDKEASKAKMIDTRAGNFSAGMRVEVM
jgi:class 3 adenylate cyclase/CHAT domain-containing protein